MTVRWKKSSFGARARSICLAFGSSWIAPASSRLSACFAPPTRRISTFSPTCRKTFKRVRDAFPSPRVFLHPRIARTLSSLQHCSSQLNRQPHGLISISIIFRHSFPRPGSIEADENLNFLTTLQESCINLCNAAPKDIPAILKEVLTRIRMIWSVSSFFSKVEPLTGLLRKVSNQIIVQVCWIHCLFASHACSLG